MTAGGEPPAGVGRTALGMAAVRAAETRRGDRLFDDPYAEAFLAAAPAAFDALRAGPSARSAGMGSVGAAFAAHAVLRTRFFDDYLLTATAGGIRQVVILAAGLDTRTYRLPWPAGVHLFELDLPDVLAFKGGVLTTRSAVARCRRTAVPVDLREDWPPMLRAAGLATGEATAWLAEGLLIYLSAEEAAGMLDRVGACAATASRVAFEVGGLGGGRLREQAERMPSMREYVDLWLGGLTDPAGWLAGHGWSPQHHDRAGVAVRYGRDPGEGSPGGFVVAARA